jgi:3-deoxy-D-manno-octulosonic-acid transferase
MYFVYSLLLGLGMLITSPYWLYRGFRRKDYLPSLIRRFGRGIPRLQASRSPIWIHAVSVGEVLAARSLFVALRSTRPDLPVIVSTVTLTGQALAHKELPTADAIFYFPFDWDFCVRNFLNRLAPAAVVIMETELWPNFLKHCSGRHIPVFLANGRISDKSSRRYQRIRIFVGRMLEAFAKVGVQTHEDRRRFLGLGAPEDRVVVTGNLKFDLPPPVLEPHGGLLEAVTKCLGIGPGTPVIVIGSTMKGEEAEILTRLQRLRTAIPAVKTILAPRHPERFGDVADLLQASGIHWMRRSQMSMEAPESDILLLDTIGELRAIYSLASVAVIGGSFLPYGGHNLLEPAALGKAIVFGPEMSNFRELASLFLREQAARQCTLDQLAPALVELLTTDAARRLLGERAARTYRQNQGATETTLNFILPHVR